ncbi:tetratricopeptide repeat protein [Planktothrix sp. FACHB-1355]|uniref:Tetratricopeptide repeat protein n=1 Tax=Aerosakkonema funiforme FACHB-1375 TaxID=2949571 RepID=A0A926VJ16_9CYAN|nr:MULTISPECIES: tetratricopeptide repeat protein [Oscillatoriales]MBD2184774.1 tetratricopeptide repeat protein [Aerosakkonema funiforme FACHB-1375]MBD3559057.1 tetratricopeptide repeat protein [Planktothrix sp. FACHB-1355]
MQSQLPIVYISILLVLLSGTAWLIFQQVFKTRKVETTLTRLQNKLKNEKGTAQEYYELGSIYLDKKLFSQSVQVFQRALKAAEEEAPQNTALIYNGLGFAYFAQEQYDAAIRNYKEALKLQPNYPTALNNLGHAYEKKKLTAQALQTYDEALKYEPNNSTAKRRAESLRKRLVPST